MDHKEAVQLQAAIKYVLGELPPAERDSFEEHYFDCGECALDVKAAAAFVDASREVLRTERVEAAAGRSVENGRGWLAWFRPTVAVPAFAVLLMGLGYQSLVSVPHWKKAALQASAPRVLPMYSLIGANSRGPEGLVFHVGQSEVFGLYVDIPADASYRRYVLRLEDPAGHSALLRSLTYEESQKTQVVEVSPGGSGAYRLVVLGLPTGEGDPAKGTVLATMKFNVEFAK